MNYKKIEDNLWEIFLLSIIFRFLIILPINFIMIILPNLIKLPEITMTEKEIWITLLFISPIFEELLFRKFLFGLIAKYNFWWAIFISTFIYSLFGVDFISLSLLNVFFIFIYYTTKNIWYAIYSHFVFNAFARIIIFYKIDIFIEKYLEIKSIKIILIILILSLIYPFYKIAIKFYLRNRKDNYE
ncbi:CAAX prenyl protease-like protein [Hypnocyclicus thermotrophus]|uniref:CAAX prenyl protease-like protein n=1 Tax=Hypnocyclicus thermotrophus TaxID=1627895 RepID=A0AA46E0J0_9FUSO|nr:CPBP family intramembrane glutamic endopeptidase [Hypnocyclicus thermotrophus]TDT72539.1 CAAX prenyl protease-like protein [Hypnocyclicus thermotrophus]